MSTATTQTHNGVTYQWLPIAAVKLGDRIYTDSYGWETVTALWPDDRPGRTAFGLANGGTGSFPNDSEAAVSR